MINSFKIIRYDNIFIANKAIVTYTHTHSTKNNIMLRCTI